MSICNGYMEIHVVGWNSMYICQPCISQGSHTSSNCLSRRSISHLYIGFNPSCQIFSVDPFSSVPIRLRLDCNWKLSNYKCMHAEYLECLRKHSRQRSSRIFLVFINFQTRNTSIFFKEESSVPNWLLEEIFMLIHIFCPNFMESTYFPSKFPMNSVQQVFTAFKDSLKTQLCYVYMNDHTRVTDLS